MSDDESLEGSIPSARYTRTGTNTGLGDGTEFSISDLEIEDPSTGTRPSLRTIRAKPRSRVNKISIIAGAAATIIALSFHGHRLFPAIHGPEEMEKMEQPIAPAPVEERPPPSTVVPAEPTAQTLGEALEETTTGIACLSKIEKKINLTLGIVSMRLICSSCHCALLLAKKAPSKVELAEKAPPKVDPESKPPSTRQPLDSKPSILIRPERSRVEKVKPPRLKLMNRLLLVYAVDNQLTTWKLLFAFPKVPPPKDVLTAPTPKKKEPPAAYEKAKPTDTQPKPPSPPPKEDLPEKKPPPAARPRRGVRPRVRGFRGDGSIPELRNKKQWRTDIERSKEISASDGKWVPVPLNKHLKDQQERAARASLAAVVQKLSKPTQRKFSTDQKAQIKLAQQILQGHGGKGRKDLISVKGFRSSAGSGDVQDAVEFAVRGVLEATDLGVVFEVEPTDEKIRELLGGKTLAMKIAIQSLDDAATEDEVGDCADFLYFSVNAEKGMLNKLRVEGESAQETIERTGVLTPTFCANLEVEEETGQVKGGVFHKQLLFSPTMSTDFLSVARQQESKGGLTTNQKLFVVKRMLLALGHVHAAGILHNDLKLDKLRFDENGNLFLTDFAGAAGIGRMRDLWSTANAAPEQVKEIQDGSPMTGTDKGEAWGVGMAAFLALTNEAPFEWDQSDSYLKRLFGEDEEVLSPQFDVTQYPSPAFAMRKLSLPEEWVCAVTALLQPEAKHRATVRQVLKHFPNLFE
ncbi:hypothetical protein Emag_001594 [Eimeria magna]